MLPGGLTDEEILAGLTPDEDAIAALIGSPRNTPGQLREFEVALRKFTSFCRACGREQVTEIVRDCFTHQPRPKAVLSGLSIRLHRILWPLDGGDDSEIMRRRDREVAIWILEAVPENVLPLLNRSQLLKCLLKTYVDGEAVIAFKDAIKVLEHFEPQPVWEVWPAGDLRDLLRSIYKGVITTKAQCKHAYGKYPAKFREQLLRVERRPRKGDRGGDYRWRVAEAIALLDRLD